MNKFLVCVCTAVFSLSFSSNLSSDEITYSPHLDLGGYGFNHSPHGAGLGELFIPIFQDPSFLFYSDIRGIVKSDAAREGNFGIASRYLNLNKERLFGGYAFYDLKRSDQKNLFHQVNIGLECWLNRWFVGINGYFPVGKSKYITEGTLSNGTVEVRPSGNFNNIFFRASDTNSETALPGGDFLLGYEPIDNLTGYVGGFYFKRSNFPTVAGPIGRMRYFFRRSCNRKILSIFDSVSFESQIQYDKVRKFTWYGGLRFIINFKGKTSECLPRIARHMIETPLRDIDVISVPQTEPSPFQRLNNADGSPVNVLPVKSLVELESGFTNSLANIIAVDGIISGVNSLQIGNDQIITGKNYPFSVDGVTLIANLSSGGELQSESGTNLLEISSNNTIRDMTLTMIDPQDGNANNRAVSCSSSIDDLGVNVIDNVISNGRIIFERDGISQTGNLQISNSTVSTADWKGSFNGPLAVIADNGSRFTIDIQDNTLLSLPTDVSAQIVALRLIAQAGGFITVENLHNNTIRGSDAGVAIALQEGGTFSFSNGIVNNYIEGGATGGVSEIGLLMFHFGSSRSTLTVNGGIVGNTLIGTNDACSLQNFGGAEGIDSQFLGGFINNTCNGQRGIALQARPTDTLNIFNFYGNQITSSGPNIALSNSSEDFTITVNFEGQGLSEANNDAIIVVGGTETPHVIPSL